MLNLAVTVSILVMLWAGCWQVSADDVEGVAYGTRVLLKADGTWEYSEESIKAKSQDGKAVVLNRDNTWEYIELQLKGAITFRIADFNEKQESEVKRNDEGQVIGVEVETGCSINLEVGNTLDVPIKLSGFNVYGAFDVDNASSFTVWYFSDLDLFRPGEKRLVNSYGGSVGLPVLYPNRTEVTEDEKKTLVDNFGCKAIEGMTLVLTTEKLATGIETVPPAATDVDIVSMVQTLPNEVVNFESRWRVTVR